MGILDAVEKLEASNKELKVTLEEFHEQFVDLHADPRFIKLPIDELENLFLAYVKTWISTNTDVLEMLVKPKNNVKNTYSLTTLKD
jgi:hypothetical protein